MNKVFKINTKRVELEDRPYTIQELRELGLIRNEEPRVRSVYYIQEWRDMGMTEKEIDAQVRAADRAAGYHAPEPVLEEKELGMMSIFGGHI